MARYYFHVHNDLDTVDEEGKELPDAAAALSWARHEVQLLAADSVKTHAHLVLGHGIVVADEAGKEVHHVRFGDVISVQP